MNPQTYPARPGPAEQLPAQPVPEFYEQFYLARAADLQSQDHQLAMALRAQAQQHAAPYQAYPQPVYPQQPYAPQPQVIYTQSRAALPPGVVKYCACAVSTGAALALTGWGLGQAAPALVDLAHLIYATAALGVVGALLWVVFGLGGAGGGATGGGGGRRQGSGDTYITHNHQQITGRGFLGRAQGSITTNNGQ